VNHCRVIDVEGQLKTVRYEPNERPAEAPVGRVEVDEGIDAAIDEFIAALPPSEFLPDIERDLRESYAAGTGFAVAFAKLMARIFKDYGVVLIDPLDEELKQVAAPLYAKAIERAPEIARALVERSRELVQAGYHAQVNVSEDIAPLFIMDDGKRTAMTQRDGRFYVKGSSNRSFSQEELAELAGRCPNCFSPNVTFRPVVQDWLLPTAAYIGGPAEIAYFAQIRAVYEVLERQEPCVLPRASLTVIEHRHRKTLKKLKLELPDFFDGLHAAITKVVEQSLDRETADNFAETERVMNEQLDRLEASLRRADGSLSDAVKNARAKIVYQLEHLRTRFVHTSAHREETIYRQVERAYATLFPDKNLQERELNIFYLLARYGPSLMRDLYDAVEIGYSNHKYTYLSGMPSQVVNAVK
jgi:bacillithiol synthase